jgi:hypothetical protein|tara:strand:+ start:79 stop:252 length:174 start_codon:yes stop_codon:yes gene_type:complete
MKPNQQLTQSREDKRKANRIKFAWAADGFDQLNKVFGPLEVIKLVDEDGVVTRPQYK